MPLLLNQEAKSTLSVPVVYRKWMVPVPAQLPLAFKQQGEKMNAFNYFMLINHSGLLSLDVQTFSQRSVMRCANEILHAGL